MVLETKRPADMSIVQTTNTELFFRTKTEFVGKRSYQPRSQTSKHVADEFDCVTMSDILKTI